MTHTEPCLWIRGSIVKFQAILGISISLVRVFNHISIFVADIFNIRLHKARLVKHLAVDFEVDCVLLRKIEKVTRIIAAN